MFSKSWTSDQFKNSFKRTFWNLNWESVSWVLVNVRIIYSGVSSMVTTWKLAKMVSFQKNAYKFHNEIDTPCKHIIYIYLYIFNIPESLYTIEPLYLTKTELKKLSLSLFEFLISEETALTTRALLKLSSNISKFWAPTQPQLKSSDGMPTKLSLTEPQSDTYWILKRLRHIKNCHGCKEKVEENVIRR